MPETTAQTLICDTREPWPHPWENHLPGVIFRRETLETGDFALAGLLSGAIVERKTVPDFLACVTRERDRFTKELLRARYCQSFAIVVEGGLATVLSHAGGCHPTAILGTVAAWTRRGFPVVFAGSPLLAAQFTHRFLVQQITEAERVLRACRGALPGPILTTPETAMDY